MTDTNGKNGKIVKLVAPPTLEDDSTKQSIEALEYMLNKAKEGKMHSVIVIGNLDDVWFWDYAGFPDFFQMISFLEHIKMDLITTKMGNADGSI